MEQDQQGKEEDGHIQVPSVPGERQVKKESRKGKKKGAERSTLDRLQEELVKRLDCTGPLLSFNFIFLQFIQIMWLHIINGPMICFWPIITRRASKEARMYWPFTKFQFYIAFIYTNHVVTYNHPTHDLFLS